MSNDVVNRIIRARASLLQMAPFFGVTVRKLKLQEDKACKSMWTDTIALGYNPSYVASASILEIQAVLCKLVMQIGAGHAWRQGPRDSVLWNKASTLAVLPSVRALNLVYPSKEAERPELDGKSAEGIYLVLQQEKQSDKEPPTPPPPTPSSAPGAKGESNSEGDGTDSGQDEQGENAGNGASPGSGSGNGESTGDWLEDLPVGEIRPVPAGEEAKQATEWATAVKNAATLQGNLPGQFVLQLKDALIRPLPWKRELQHFARKVVGNGRYSFAKPNRNHLHRGLILPTRGNKKRLGTVVVVRDTSGSAFNGPYLGMFNAAISEMVEVMQPEKVYILDVDTRVTKVQTVVPDRHEKLEQKAEGGGGTDFRPPFEWIKEQRIPDVAALIYLTDMCGTFPAHGPQFPVLWVKTDLVYANHVKAPFGQEIVLKEA